MIPILYYKRYWLYIVVLLNSLVFDLHYMWQDICAGKLVTEMAPNIGEMGMFFTSTSDRERTHNTPQQLCPSHPSPGQQWDSQPLFCLSCPSSSCCLVLFQRWWEQWCDRKKETFFCYPEMHQSERVIHLHGCSLLTHLCYFTMQCLDVMLQKKLSWFVRLQRYFSQNWSGGPTDPHSHPC